MSILDRLVDNTQHDRSEPEPEPEPQPEATPAPDVVDLTGDAPADAPDDAAEVEAHEDDTDQTHVLAGPRHDPRVPVHGLRIRRVRLRSVAKIASVFWVLGYLVSLGTLVVLWNAALALGFVDTIEETVTTSLGLDEAFTMVGADLFRVALFGLGFLFALGLLLTVLLALVYNVACAAFGGLAVETGPLRRRRRVFSLRHRGFVTVRS